MIDNILQFIGMTTTLYSIYLMAVPKILGFWISILSQVFWIIFAIRNKHYILAFQCFCILIFCCFGLYQWRKKGVG
jgi:nicotinamide riboside transporter PnuC